jgi:hypothetical protein
MDVSIGFTAQVSLDHSCLGTQCVKKHATACGAPDGAGRTAECMYQPCVSKTAIGRSGRLLPPVLLFAARSVGPHCIDGSMAAWAARALTRQ